MILRLGICFLLINLLISCTEEYEKKDITNNLKVEILDSILVESNNIIRYLSFDQKSNKYLFLEENLNNLILYNHHTKTQQNLSELKETFPEFNNQILGGHLDYDDIFLFTTHGYFRYSISESKIHFNKKGVVAREIPSAIKFTKHEDAIITNLTLYESLSKKEFKKFSYAQYDNSGVLTHILADNEIKNAPPDVRKYIDFVPSKNLYYSYIFPFDKIYFGSIDSLSHTPELKYLTIETDFLSEHPFYTGEKFGIEDFRYIPVVYDFEASANLIYIHLNEGGNRETKQYDGNRYLVVFGLNGELENNLLLENELLSIEEVVSENVFLFSLIPKEELPDHTKFKIVKISN